MYIIYYIKIKGHKITNTNLTQKISIPRTASTRNYQLVQGGTKVLEKSEKGLNMYSVQNVGPKGVYCFCDNSDKELYVTWDKF